jgi:hypothetical protein
MKVQVGSEKNQAPEPNEVFDGWVLAKNQSGYALLFDGNEWPLS